MSMPGRTYSSGSYRYGFNGQENDNETKGIGNQLNYDARIYDPRLGRFLSTDFFGALKPGISGYNFVSNNPLSRIDPDGNFDVDSKASKREKKALTAMGNSYSAYLKGLEKGSQELNSLLTNSGYTSKEDLIAAWDKKGPGSIMLRFSVHNESSAVPDHGHERTSAVPPKDPYYLHPDGNGQVDGAYATGSGVLHAGGTIIFARTILTFQESLNSKKWVIPAAADFDNPNENMSFDYDAMKTGGYQFLNRIISHELTHVGADVNGMPRSVWAANGTMPSWVGQDAMVTFGGALFTLYHRGDVFEYNAYLKPVTHTDAQYGFAVNVYFRALGGMDCTVKKNPIVGDNVNSSIKQAIWNYIRANQQSLRSFRPNNSSNRGDFKIPVSLDH